MKYPLVTSHETKAIKENLADFAVTVKLSSKQIKFLKAYIKLDEAYQKCAKASLGMTHKEIEEALNQASI